MSYVGSRGGGYKVSEDLQRSPEISRDLQRSPDLQRYPEISRSPEISRDLQWGEYIKDVLCQRGLQRGEYTSIYHLNKTQRLH